MLIITSVMQCRYDLSQRPDRHQLSSQYLAHLFDRVRLFRTVPTNSKVFLRGLLNMRELQILSALGIQK